MKIFVLPIGDWSGDGHGKCHYEHILVPDQFDLEVLTDSYNWNKEQLGFGLDDFASDYEDPYLPRDKYTKLIEAGFKFREDTTWSDEHQADDPEDMAIDLTVDAMVDIAMFFFGNQLEGFTWDKLKTDGDLIGTADTEYGCGYGLFY